MIWTYVATALAALAIGFGGGWQTRSWKAGADHAAQLAQSRKDEHRRTEQADRAAGTLEKQKAATEVRWRTVTREVEREVEKPVYRNICIGPDGLRQLADEIGRNTHSGEPAPAVPAASAAVR